MRRARSKLCVIALTILLAACDPILTTFRVGLASSRPLAQSLASSGLIPLEKVDAIVADFDAGAQCGQTVQADFKAIPSDLPKAEKKQRKYEASLKGLQCFRAIINHHNFALHKRLQDAANIAEGILASLVIFYDTSGGAARAAVGAISASQHIVTAKSEKELKRKLKAKTDKLEEAMKP